MRSFFLNSCVFGIWAITVVEYIMICLFFNQWKKAEKEKKMMIFCMMMITVGLFIDALFISLGTLLNENVLRMVSPLRFISHGVLIPLIFPICGYGLKTKKPITMVIWAITAVLMVAGLMEALFTQLEMKEIAGVVRFVSGENTPGWAETISRILSFGTVIPLMIAGIVIGIKSKHFELFVGGLLMFVFSALGPATGNADLIFYISMFGEVLMVLFFFLFTLHKN